MKTTNETDNLDQEYVARSLIIGLHTSPENTRSILQTRALMRIAVALEALAECTKVDQRDGARWFSVGDE